MNNPYRRSIRLAGVDYRGERGYFITICLADRRPLFGTVTDGEITLSPLGRIADEELHAVTIHRPYVFLDAYVIMPDHMHAILFINHDFASQSVDPQLAAAPHNPIASVPQPVSGPISVPPVSTRHSDLVGPQQAAGLQGVVPQSLSAIVRGYKSAVTKHVNDLRRTPGATVWQRNYYDHIIRNEHDLNLIRAYIENNPARWTNDRNDSFNPPVWN